MSRSKHTPVTPEGNSLRIFHFGTSQIRTAIGPDGEPRWVAKDVAEALGYAKASNAARLFASVPEEWKGVNPIHTPGGEQEALVLSEPGLFFFLNRSDKPAALPLQKWVAGDVLPAIRRTGAYVAPGVASEVVAQAVIDALGTHATWRQPLAEKIEQARRDAKGAYELVKGHVLPALLRLEAQRAVTLGGISAREAVQLLNAIARTTTSKRAAQEAASRILPGLIPTPPAAQAAHQPALPGLEA